MLTAESDHLAAFIAKMTSAGLQPVVMDTFAWYYHKVVTGEKGFIYNRDIRPVEPHDIADSTTFAPYADIGREMMPQAVMIVLNGGLGTSMGLTGAKSLLPARNGKTFLEIIVRQADHQRVRLALMNSFNTHAETVVALERLQPAQLPLLFVQNKFPKILRRDFSPAEWPCQPDLEWNPPGHGDIYTALYTSGILDQLLSDGIQYAFIANSDNLGATLDPSLLGYFAEKSLPFMMEVSIRKPVDIKGGHLAVHKNGHLILREAAQCTEEEIAVSRDITRYRYFNTNNIWINLKRLKAVFDRYGVIHLPMILNPKTLDPRDSASPEIYQVETAMGSAISLVEGAAAVVVPRSRFYPVKKCNELLVIRSDRFIYSDQNGLQANRERLGEQIQVDLDPRYYTMIDAFDARFPFGPPSLAACESLTVSGNVFFGKNIALKGNVVIRHSGGAAGYIPDDKVIEGTLSL